MAVTIGSNISSLRTIRQLDATTRNLASTSERLASGQRINRASDDAAGLAIASSLNTQSRILTKAVANVNDGISLLSIAEGAVRELASIVTRISELAEQSANGVYRDSQRTALNNEAQSLAAEYSRITTTTKFNGLRILDDTTIKLQIGEEGSCAAQLEIGNLDLGADSLSSLVFDGVNDYVSLGSVTMGQNLTVSAWIKSGTTNQVPILSNRSGSGAVYFGMQAGKFFVHDYTAGAQSAMVSNANVNNDQWHHVTWTSEAGVDKMYIDGNLDSTLARTRTASTGVASIGWDTANVVDYFSGAIDDVRVYNRAVTASEVTTLANGDNPSATGLSAHWKFSEGAGTTTVDSSGYGNTGTLTNGPTWSSDGSHQLISSSLDGFSLATQQDSLLALDFMNTRLSSLTAKAGEIGAQLSRLYTAGAVIASTRENYQAASGRISDADVAQESANLVRHGILQQTASGVLAQANQQPQIAIQLLGAI